MGASDAESLLMRARERLLDAVARYGALHASAFDVGISDQSSPSSEEDSSNSGTEKPE